MDIVRIAVDFNTMSMDTKRRVRIGREGSEKNQELLRALHPGLSVVLYEDEMQVRAIIEYDAKRKIWFGRPDWSTRELLYPEPAVGSQAAPPLGQQIEMTARG
jgi:hypothetical protein